MAARTPVRASPRFRPAPEQAPTPARAPITEKKEEDVVAESTPAASSAEETYLTPLQAALLRSVLGQVVSHGLMSIACSAAVSFLAVPVLLLLDDSFVVSQPLYLALTGVAVCGAIFWGAYKFIFARLPPHARDPYVAFFILFGFTCVIDFVLAAEIDYNIGWIDW